MILCYHNLIRDAEVDENLYRRSYEGAPLLYYRKESMFKNDMARIIENILLDDYLTKNGVAITFDDGRLNNYEIAFPIMKKFGLKGSFFVSTSKVGQPDYMTWNQLREIADFGNTIESHGHLHKPFDEMTDEQVLEDITKSADLIEKGVGRRPHFLSLPGGREVKKDLVKQAGYIGIRTSEKGINDDIWNLWVVMMLNNSV